MILVRNCHSYFWLCQHSQNSLKRTGVLGFRLILFLYIGCFLQDQPDYALKVFLKLFLKIKYSIDYQQIKSACKHNFPVNSWMELTLTASIKAIILHWGRGSSSGDKRLETQQKSSKFKMHQPSPPPSFHVTIDWSLILQAN